MYSYCQLDGFQVESGTASTVESWSDTMPESVYSIAGTVVCNVQKYAGQDTNFALGTRLYYECSILDVTIISKGTFRSCRDVYLFANFISRRLISLSIQ